MLGMQMILILSQGILDMRSLTLISLTAVDSILGAAEDMEINISKTKYMFSTRNKSQRQSTHSLTLWSIKFEVVKEDFH